ncbi:MAG: hypothetical protein NUV61_00215 [Candidatus Azambacteria bacterium]|nr:hypothetical protein [Candidatus Azambacteria bacterium]
MRKKKLRGKQQEEESLVFTRELMITEARALLPKGLFLITLENKTNHTNSGEEKGILTVDEQTAHQHRIPLTPDTLGEKLICTLTCVPYDPILTPRNKAALFVESLLREERVTPIYNACPAAGRTKVCRTLTVATPDKEGPFGTDSSARFRITILLSSEDEYRACKKCLPHSVFEVGFYLKP